MENKNENLYLTTAPVKKLLLKFAIPCVLAMLVSALYNIVDQIFLGNSSAGSSGIMATTLVFPFTVVALAIALFIGDGCATLFSISLGSKDETVAKKSIGNAILCAIFSSALLTALGYILLNPILSILGANGYDPTTQLYTKQYLIIILAGIPFYVFSSTTASIIRADGSPRYSMISTIIGAVINIIFDPILIFVFKLGVQGAAIATIAGQVVSSILCVLYFRKMKMVKLNKESFKIDWKVIRKILKLGISSLITQISIAIITIVANNVVGAVGKTNATDAGAALGIVFKVFAIVIAFSIGIAVGAQPIIGYNFGAKKYKRVVETYKLVLISNLVVGLIAMILFEAIPGYITAIFGQGSEFYKNYAVLSFRIYLGGILLCCIQKASCIFLQSIDRPYKAMIFSLLRDVILLVPGVCILAFCGDLYTMLWAGLIADVGAFIPTIIVALFEVKKMKNQNNAKENPLIQKENLNNFVISISREYGSGGKYIGQEVAKRLGIKCYDNSLLTKVSQEFNIDLKTLKNVDEKQKSSFWYGFASNYSFDTNSLNPISPEDNLFLKQAKVIEELADNESCVIIGRCSNFVLKGRKNLISVFVHSSDIDFKAERKVNLEGQDKQEVLKNIEKIDKLRANYYTHFTGQKWGDPSNYDLCIDSSKLGVENSIEFIENYIREKFNIKK